MSFPWKSMWPSVGSSSRAMRRPVVVFPQPDSPTSPRISPWWRSKPIPSTAWTWMTWPRRDWRNPALKKYFELKAGFLQSLRGHVIQVHAVDGIGFDLHQGEILGLVGE